MCWQTLQVFISPLCEYKDVCADDALLTMRHHLQNEQSHIAQRIGGRQSLQLTSIISWVLLLLVPAHGHPRESTDPTRLDFRLRLHIRRSGKVNDT